MPVPHTNPPPRLSVCIIARNEEAFLPACLRSVAPLAPQTVVVDTGSEDNTPALARAAGAEVVSFAWRDDFSAARNASIACATGEWILVLDADEELTPEAAQTLPEEMADARVIAYRLPLFEASPPHDGPHYVPRLFRNVPEAHYTGRIHEQVFPSLEPVREKLGLENRLGRTRILHHGYSGGVARNREKAARNLCLLERELAERPADANLLMNYGLELVRNGQPDEGLVAYRQAFGLLASIPPGRVVPELRETLLTQLASRLFAAGRFSEVIDRLSGPLGEGMGLSASLHLILGLALLRQGQAAKAAPHFLASIARRDDPVCAPPLPQLRTGIPFHCLGHCLARCGQDEEALGAFTEAARLSPNSQPIQADLAHHRLHSLAHSHSNS